MHWQLQQCKIKNLGRWTSKITSAGSLGAQLKTVDDLMITGKKIPFINENLKMSDALKILSEKIRYFASTK